MGAGIAAAAGKIRGDIIIDGRRVAFKRSRFLVAFLLVD
jgi:hypothetical protein